MKNVRKDDYIILNQHINGLVQAAQKNYLKVGKILKHFGFVGASIDPCLYVKKIIKSIVYVDLYLDNNLIIGDTINIDDIINTLKNKGLVIKTA